MDEQSILQRIAAGDTDAVNDCIETYGGLVWSLARRRGLSQSVGEDVVQEAFIDIWKSAARFDPERSSETTFVAMIARRRIIDRLRSRGRRPTMQLIDATIESLPSGDERRVESATEATFAYEALSSLKPDERKVVLLSTHQGMSHGQIAKATGIPLGTVKTYIRRSLAKVRELLTVRSQRREEAR